MANDEHFKILKRGSKYWNDWRRNNPKIKPDLVHIVQVKKIPKPEEFGITYFKSLIYVETIIYQKKEYKWVLDPDLDLSEINLAEANLAEACFVKSNFSKANLSNTNLCGTKFIGSNLAESNLYRVVAGEADFSGSNLNRANIEKGNFRWADIESTDFSNAFIKDANFQSVKGFFAIFNKSYLENANFKFAILTNSQFQEANLKLADFNEALLSGANFEKAILAAADFTSADLTKANLSNTDLRVAELKLSRLVEANLTNADISHSTVYGISSWNINLTGTKQNNLVITPEEESEITVDNIEVAQFVYLILNNAKIRQVIDTIGQKAVLILGRFTDNKKKVLNAIKDELRKHNYLPILFDFKQPQTRDLTETISILAHMSRFVIADLSDAKSIPQELQALVPNLPSVAFQPIINESDTLYGMFEHFAKYPWVMPIIKYSSLENLLENFNNEIIEPIEYKVKEIRKL